jgi:hypothetical protein
MVAAPSQTCKHEGGLLFSSCVFFYFHLVFCFDFAHLVLIASFNVVYQDISSHSKTTAPSSQSQGSKVGSGLSSLTQTLSQLQIFCFKCGKHFFKTYHTSCTLIGLKLESFSEIFLRTINFVFLFVSKRCAANTHAHTPFLANVTENYRPLAILSD